MAPCSHPGQTQGREWWVSERDKDGLLQSNGNTICVLDRVRESAPPRPKSDLENKPK